MSSGHEADSDTTMEQEGETLVFDMLSKAGFPVLLLVNVDHLCCVSPMFPDECDVVRHDLIRQCLTRKGRRLHKCLVESTCLDIYRGHRG